MKPPLPLQFSSRAQPALIDSIRLSPAFLPVGRKTSHSPSQKSNCRYSALWQAGGGGVGVCAWAVRRRGKKRGQGRGGAKLVVGRHGHRSQIREA